MNYLVCENCQFETRELAESCKKCGTPYICDWDPAWYESSLTLASMGRSKRARQFGSTYAICALAFTFYGLVANTVTHATRDAWGNYFVFTLFLLFCSYEVWSFTRGKVTTIDRYSHEGVPKNTDLRVLGLVLDLTVSAWAVYQLLAHDA